MADTKADGRKDSTGSAQGRFVVSLPQDMGPQIDAIAVRIGKAVQEQTGVSVDLSRAQVVQSLVKSALDRSESEAPAAA